MNRKHFLQLVGSAFGYCQVPPALAQTIEDTCVIGGKPYFIEPSAPGQVLSAVSSFRGYDLHLGEPWAEPSPPSWRDFLESRGVNLDSKEDLSEAKQNYFGVDEDEEEDFEIDLEEEIDGSALGEWMEWDFELRESSLAQAYRYLDELSLSNLDSDDGGASLGELDFIEGDRPGSNLTYVSAPDLASLACLQHRLNELDENLKIEVMEGD